MSLSRREDSLSISDKERIDRICLALEDAWLSGQRPVLESFLATIPSRLQALLLREMLSIELEYRRNLAEQVRLDDYLVRFPGFVSVVKETYQLVEQRDVRRQFLPGHSIGRYQVKRLLGSGAFGSVYLAWDSQLERQVAIKVPHSCQLQSARDRHRFIAEARASANLEHPGIVRMLDACQLEDGTVYLVMQYIEGVSLRELLDRGPLTYDKAIQITGQVARALGVAHRRGVIHRDLKPGNILIDQEGQVFVTDFGLALRESEQDQCAGECAGTLAYMAPEQLHGNAHHLDGRADIWAIGVILYQMLTDRFPFAGPSRELLSDEILHRDPRPPRQIDARIPKHAETACLCCLAKRPADRYPTADDVAAALQPGTAKPTFGKRGVALAAVALLLIIGTIGWIPSIRDPIHPTAVPSPDLQPTQGTIRVYLWNPQDPGRQGVCLGQDAVGSLRVGDQVRLDVQLDQPAYVYLVWLDSRLQPLPIYPWQHGKWDQRPAEEHVCKQLTLPGTENHGWQICEGPSGLETILLLARSAPLPPHIDLPAIFQELPHVPASTRDTVWSFQHGQLLTTADSKMRAPLLEGEVVINDPLLHLQRQLARRLRPHFSLICTITFPFHGLLTDHTTLPRRSGQHASQTRWLRGNSPTRDTCEQRI